jgi:type IV pilus assembly protein PilE|tara:strand:+ start:666 stop:1061 length:396 start_codon:yes stop_codon:yes gene_type:complete
VKPLDRGFSLVELIVVVAILGVLAAVGVPMYLGYIDSARATDAQNGLRSIHLMQQEYNSDNDEYYTTGEGDKTADINTNLFGGDETLNGEYYQFYIQQGDAADGGYIACGEDKVDSSKIYKINAYNKTTNF